MAAPIRGAAGRQTPARSFGAKMKQQILIQLAEWIRATAGERGLLVPVSGGTDSALCFWLCQQALPAKAVAVHFGETLRGHAWFESLGPIETIPLPPEQEEKELTRWALLLSLSTRRRVWLVGSRNRTEDVFSTFSLASRVATYYPIVSLWKSEVLDLCGLIGVPEEIIASSHQADPLCGRTELMAEIGVERIDRFLKVKEGELPADELTILPADHLRYLDETYQRGQYKRNLPIRAPRF